MNKPDWILAVGDSCTWGTEITVPCCSMPEDLEKSWPKHLAKLFGTPNLVNRGWPGRSNDSIFRTAIQDMTRFHRLAGDNGLVVIGWTALYRWEVCNPFILDVDLTDGGRHPGQEGPYLTINIADLLPSGRLEKELPELIGYYKDFRTQESHELELFYNYVLSTTALAKSLGLKILHFNAVDEIRKENLPPPSKHLEFYLGKEFYNPYDRKSAMWPKYSNWERSFTGDGKIKQSPRHPNAEEHADWAKILFDYLNEIY